MTAAETIQAAIDRLEQLKADSTPGEWVTSIEGLSRPRGLDIKAGRVWVASDGDGYQGAIGNHADAELIVALHRTIDATLELLRWQMEGFFPGGDPFIDEDGLAFARAILGEAS